MTIRTVTCPTCRRDVIWDNSNPYRPFCSKRCRTADLGAWAEERYSITGAICHPDDDNDEQPVDEPS